MGKKHNKDIVPMKRRFHGVSKTAKRVQDWKYCVKLIKTKAEQEKFLRTLKHV